MNINILKPGMFNPIYYRKYSKINNKKIYGDNIRVLVKHFIGKYRKKLEALMSHNPSFKKELDLEVFFLRMQNKADLDEPDVEKMNANAIKTMRDFITKEFLCYANCYWKYDREVFYQKKSD